MTEENTKMEEKLGENGILEYEAVNLFPPIVIGGAHIDLDPEWIEKVKIGHSIMVRKVIMVIC